MNIMHQLKHFAQFLTLEGIDDITEVQQSHIYAFVAYIRAKISNRGREFSADTVIRIISSLRHFFKFLYRNDYILLNPMEEFSTNIKANKNRKEIFTFAEMTKFLDSIGLKSAGLKSEDINEKNGLRDRAIFELMYSSGLRISEIVKLDLSDIDLNERILLVREGKGSKDRFVPFSEMAALLIMKYIEVGRKCRRFSKRDEYALFIGEFGRMKTQVIRLYFRKYLKACGITKKNLSPHSIRHSCATHLLEAGADVRYVQELLGHEYIQTTVKYTHLMIDSLKRVYKTYHPRENQCFEEIDEEYLRSLDELKKEVKKLRHRNRSKPLKKQ
jgi:integrase/recombinase XerC